MRWNSDGNVVNLPDARTCRDVIAATKMRCRSGEGGRSTMPRRLSGCCLLVSASLVGCGDSAPSPTAHPPDPITAELLVVNSINPGPRPPSIREAKFYTADEFLAAGTAGHVAKGEWVCIEGTVIRSGELFGAPYVAIAAGSDHEFHCEGYDLARFRIDPGTNVVVRGRVSAISKGLGDTTPVTQGEIDQALREESELQKADAIDD